MDIVVETSAEGVMAVAGEELRHLIEALDHAVDAVDKVRNRPPSSPHQNGKPSWWVMVLLVANLGLFGWVLETLVSVKEDVAVIKCQLSDNCKHVVTRGTAE